MTLIKRATATAFALTIFAAGCGSTDTATPVQSDATESATSDSADNDNADSDNADSEDTPTDNSAPELDTETDTETETAEVTTSDVGLLFADGALTADATVVPCTLENGSETTCYQLEVDSLPATVDTDGPFCPATVNDVGGLWVWDGDEPGLYNLNPDFWTMMDEQGFDFVGGDGETITVTDPGGGAANGGGTPNSCLEATPDGSYHLQVLIPTTPEDLATPTSLTTVSQVGLALDGVTIFGDAPSVADRGGLPALDACGGHIDPSGYYHWHFGAESIQTNIDAIGADLLCQVSQDAEALIGFSYDGYPIYGPEENGSIATDLDECSGHVGETADFGETYHYHLTYDSPNLPTCRIGASANGKLSSPDNANVSLPDNGGGGGGGRGPRPENPPEGNG